MDPDPHLLSVPPPAPTRNTTATCPPTQGQISTGFPCIVTVAEFDPVALTPGTHVGFRVFNMKSPIPTKLCDPPGAPVSFGACGATIPRHVGTADRCSFPVQGPPARRSGRDRQPGLVRHRLEQQDHPDQANSTACSRAADRRRRRQLGSTVTTSSPSPSRPCCIRASTRSCPTPRTVLVRLRVQPGLSRLRRHELLARESLREQQVQAAGPSVKR